MKAFLAIGLFFVFPVNIASLQIYDESLNPLRRRFAKNIQVANMHEMKYNEDLMKEVPPINCSDRFMLNWNSELFPNNLATSIESLVDLLQKAPDYTLAQCLNPVKTEFGCRMKECEMDHVVRNCICEPRDIFKRDDVKEGKPGSKCENGENDGLCLSKSDGQDKKATESGGKKDKETNDGGDGQRSEQINHEDYYSIIGNLLNLIIFYLVSDMI